MRIKKTAESKLDRESFSLAARIEFLVTTTGTNVAIASAGVTLVKAICEELSEHVD
jgi:hypothetical protein